MKNIVRFLRAIPSAPEPQRADRSCYGTLPTRAFRHCAAVTAASAFGWHIYPPSNMAFQAKGDEVQWTCDELDREFIDLAPVMQFPNFMDVWNEQAPERMRDLAPPFVSALIEPRTVQLWSGLMIRTAPGWNTLIRPPANLPRTQGHAVGFFEGTVETDRWFGPLFINFRLIGSDRVIFRKDWPLFQVQPQWRAVLTDPQLQRADCTPGLPEWAESDWDAYQRSVVDPNQDPERVTGNYAAEVRRDVRRSPLAGSGCPAHEAV